MTIAIFPLNCFAFQKFISNVKNFFCMLFTNFYGALLSSLDSFVKFFLSFLDSRQYLEGFYKIRSVRLSVLPFFLPSIRSSVCRGVFLEWCHYFFLNFGMVPEFHVKLCEKEPDFLGKSFLSQKLGKWAQS